MRYAFWLASLVCLGFVDSLLAAEPVPVKIIVATDHVDFFAGDDLVGRYHVGPEVAKPYIWPLYGPGQAALTRAWPMEKGKPGESIDHVHQKSVWFCHGDVIPEGIVLRDKIKDVEGVDFWSEGKGHGRIVCSIFDSPKDKPSGVGEVTTDKNHGVVRTHNQWRTADGIRILEEQRNLHFYNFGDAYLFVFDIDLEARHCPITFGDTKEGALGIRINDDIRESEGKGKKGKGKLENAEGKVGEGNCWGRVSKWCDYSGPLPVRAKGSDATEIKTVGLAVFDDPSNPSPACWHSRGYGLMAANPFGRAKSGFPAMKGKTDLVKLAKGEHLKLRYGLLLHRGDAKEGKVEEHYARYITLK